MTQMSYTAIGQLGQLLAKKPRRCSRDVPRVAFDISVRRDRSQSTPATGCDVATRPRRDGPASDRAARLACILFFATWDREISGLAGQLDYARSATSKLAAASGLPELTAVDESSVEPSPEALSPSSSPVSRIRCHIRWRSTAAARIADGYDVQGVPWFVLTSPTGRILYYWQVDRPRAG